ncbi:hypothetical protein [Planctomicrobium sp. SH664]|uniref:hypothetical protein n=1 Tax=Planctomicrobium sp. SH664 TaxID=3448125 RepID=UPI003F5B3FDC
MHLDLASLSLRTARKDVEPSSHKNSSCTFTRAQPSSCLVLRAHLQTTNRAGGLSFWKPQVRCRNGWGLPRLPHDSALKKYEVRSDILQIGACLLLELERPFHPAVREAVINSTGRKTTSDSAHDRSRSGCQRKKFIKVSVCVLGGSLLPGSLALSLRPGNDGSAPHFVIHRVWESQWSGMATR